MYLIGIDEVGRGCLAGPVVVSAVLIRKGIWLPKGLKDSKKLTEKQRNEWLVYIKSNPKIIFASATVSPKIIDRINISGAANLAALRAFSRLPTVRHAKIYLDGGLYLKNKKYQKNFNAETMIKGDQKINVIKLASIVAKVKRDKMMTKLGKLFPKYCFDVHKGYATKIHREAIKKNGLCDWHRRSFCKNFC